MKKTTFLVLSFLRIYVFFNKFKLSNFTFTKNIVGGYSVVKSSFKFQIITPTFILLLSSTLSYAQVTVPFVPRLTGGNVKVKGDVLLIGNSIIRGAGLTSPYNGNGNNNSQVGEYIDVDSDPSTFSSSTAQLAINNSCKRIVFAGLYWASIYPNEVATNGGAFFTGTPRLNDWNQVKFSLPNGTALNLTANKADPREVIYDGYNYTNINNSFKDSPVICFKDITTDLAGLTNADGTYTLANLRATRGSRNGGCAAGWTLVVIYESPTLPSKFISVFDGYGGVQGTNLINIPVAGFRTLPNPLPVNAKIGVSALEGDLGITGDSFQFKAASRPTFTPISDAISPVNNFFNSSISNNGVRITSGNPSSSNLLGYDIKNVIIANALKNVLPNDETAGELRLTTNGDGYGAFVATFAVDIIEPTILLTKEVKNAAGNDIGGGNVTLGDQLEYVIGFENQGNDDATGFTIKDILPNNIIFNYPADLGTLPPGVTHSYTPANRTLIFNIPNNLVVKNLTPGPPFTRYEIRFKVRVVPTCNDLSNACDNRIQNSAYATYRGLVNATQITDDPSLSSFTSCNLGTPQATNFLVGVSDCLFTKNEILCGASKIITASNGYASYNWTGPFGFTATGQTVTVTQPGIYRVFGVGNAPCTDYNEVITVAPFGGTTVNPINAFADNKESDGSIAVCPNNGKELPKIFLCGLTASRLINTGITGANSIVWETTNCVAPSGLSDLCANESASCTWTSAGPNGPTFQASTPGQFRVTINYDGGCFNQYYFNVYKNVLDPRATATDIICTTPGSIVVNNVPSSGYEFSIDGVNYQTSNTFVVNTQNTYTVYVRQQNIATNPCVFTVLNIGVRRRNFTVTTNATQPLCFGERGNIVVVANDVNPQYRFNIYPAGGSTAINTSGLQNFNQFTFPNLSGGSYDVEAITQDGCSEKRRITINTLTALSAAAAITKAITCTDGQITVTPQGGTAPYNYSINGDPFITDNIINVPSPGSTFSIRVVDSNNCLFTVPSITVNPVPKPVYNTTGTNVNCYGDLTGTINFNITNANGYTLAYSINNGATYGASATFSILAPGTYNTILRYSLNGDICFDTMRPITISQPSAALTASAGVSELSGCGIAPNTNFGRVRITNPQGGVAPYQYSFDNQATWITSNNALVAPGTYTLFVRDANGCIFSAPVILDPAPVPPVINVDTPVDFNCDGSATSKVTVNNPGGVNYTYIYSRNGIVNTNVPSNEFINVPAGTHTITVAYNLGVVPTFSNLLFENFGYGDDTTSPGINTAFYCFERQVAATQCKGSIQINDGDYSVTSRIVAPYGPWLQPGDHTPPTTPSTPRGRSLVVNIGDQIATSDILYQKVINDIIPNQPINFELYAFNLLQAGNTQVDVNLRVALIDATGTEISFFATGDVPKSERWEVYPKTAVTLNPGNNTSLRFIIRSNKRATSGNDVAIDDIRVYQLPKTCITTRNFTITVPTGKAFTAQITGTKNVTCNGLTNGEITISVTNIDPAKGFQYSIDNGTTWSAALFTSPVTVSNLAGALYKVIVRPVGSAVAACSKPFDVTITAPAAVTASASVITPATCTTGATIRAAGGGGTPAYQYELRAADGLAVISGFGYNNNRDFTNVPAGSYTVFVRDANGCLNPVGFAISVIAPPALTASLDVSTDYCFTTANPATLVVNVSGGTGPFTYQLDSNASISSALTTFSFTNVAPGIHTILVTDRNNCTSTISNIVIAPQIGFNVSLINDLTCLVNASIGNPVITGGNGTPYTYTVSYNTGALTAVTSFPYTATLAGNYVFTVTDSRGCPATSNTIVVTAKTTPDHTTIKTDITCNGLNNGTVTVTASAGFTTTYSYAFKLNSAATYTTQATNQFTSLSAGTYDIKVIDSKGCESIPTQVTIANPTVIATNAIATAFSCSLTNAPQSATITVAPTGGTGAYSYSYDNGVTFGSNAALTVNDNGTAQTIRVVARDANGCLSPLQTITLAPLNRPTDLTFANAAVTCTATTTTVTVTGINGVGTLSFLITGTTSATNPSFFGPVNTTGSAQAASFPSLLPGNYTFRVTDANGCYYTESYTVAAVTPIAIAPNKTSDVLCQGGTTGSGTYTVSGNAIVGAYTFTFTAGTLGSTGTLTQSGNVLTLSNVAAGTYTVRVRDNATGCEADGTIIINQPTAPLAMSITNQTNFNCNNDNAQITVLVSGGTTAYGYAAVPATPVTVPTTFASSNVVTVDTNNGSILNWVVYVRDANGCTTSTTLTIAGDPAPAPPVVTVPNQCSATGSGFTISVTPVIGSLSPYTYGISGPTGAFQAGNTFSVAPGAYTVFVKDRNGCVSTGKAVTVAAQLTASAVVSKTLDCTASPEAIISGTITGGRAPFSIVVSSGTGPGTIAQPIANTFTYTTAVASAYTFTITDANGCTTTTSATVAPITNPTVVVASQVNVSCTGGNDGSVTLTGAGGSGGYIYSNNATSGYTATATFGGLTAAGSPYTFYVRDNKGCQNSVIVTITQPANALAATAVVVPFSCSLSNAKLSGTVTINVTTGTGTAPYTYSFNSGAFTSNNVLTLNDNGSNQPYTYAVQDAKGCIISGSGTLFHLNPPVIGTITNTTIYCAPVTVTTSTVTIPVAATTGVAPLAYTIISGPVTNTSGATTGIFSGLTSGNYVFRVTDANGCYDTESYFVPPVTPIVATATKLTDVDCNGNTTGSIRYTVSGFGTGTYSYTINGVTAGTGQTAGTFNLTTLSAGPYVAVFTDGITSCTTNTTVTINQPALALSATYTTVNANCNVPTASVTVTPTGGTANYRYSFVTSSTTPGAYGTSNVANLNPTTSTSWFAHIIDANGCTFILPITIAGDPVPTVTASATGQCLGSGPFTITATGLGGVGTLSYSINGGASYQLGSTFIVTTSGNYTIAVKDANNCTNTSSVFTVAPQLTLNAVLNKDITCSLPANAQITLTATGGVGPFTYTASPATGTFAGAIFTTNTPGNYTFTVTDTTTGCTYTTTAAIPVTAPVQPVIDDVALPGSVGVTQTASIRCNGDDTAAIAIAIDNTKGQSPFVFNVQRTAPTAQNYGTQTSGLSAGDYLITVTDAKGCTDTETITIAEPPAIIVASTSTPITCDTFSGQSKGSVIVQSVIGGVGPYNYFVTGVNGYNNSELNNFGTTSVAFNVVDFGLYQINVVDSNGCSVVIQNVPVASPPTDLDISVVPVGPTCVGLGSAEVAIGSMSSITGAGPFHFAVYSPGLTYTGPTSPPWYDEDAIGSKKTTIPNLIPGVTYTFIVHDAGTGCYYFETANIPIPTNSTLTVNLLTANNITCKGAADGNVTFTINNLYPSITPVTYQIYNSQSVTPVGSVVSATIPASGTLLVSNFGLLPFGNYFVLVTEDVGVTNAGCSISSATFNITESAIDLTITAQKIKKINCNEDGIIAAFASNGTGPYTYQYLLDTVTAPIDATPGWVLNTTFATSVAGDYIVYVKDAYGCIKSVPITLDADAAPVVTAPVAPICYDGNPFTITFSGTADPAIVGAPTYSVNGSAFQSSPSFTFNAAGTYNLVIRDGNGCDATVAYEVYPQLQLTPTLPKVLDCSATPNATISLNTTGGNPLPVPANYTYEVSFNGGSFVAATTPYSASAPGTYEFRVTDANNPTVCQATATIVLDPIPATVIAAPVVTNVSCNGGSDGTITVTITSGEGPYTYTLSGTTTNATGNTSGVYTGLPVGSYVVTVRNGRGCLQASTAITVSEPTLLAAMAAAAPNTTCSNSTVITVTATGGTSSYTYNFNGLGYTSDNTFTVNNTSTPTTVNYTVKDGNGCVTASQIVTTPALTPPNDLTFAVTTTPTCPANTATVQVTATGGLGTLDFAILSPASATGNTSGATSGSFILLTPGDYIFQVTDDNGCTYQELYTVVPVTPIAIVSALINDVTCNPANGTTNDGSARFTVTGFSTSLGYTVTTSPVVPAAQITNVGDVITITGLGAGTYTVTVTDNTTLCVASDAVTITLPNPIAFTTVATKVFCTQDISQITVSAGSGGSGVYQYAVLPGGTVTPPVMGAYSSNPVLSVDTNLTALSWDIYVKDANGCVAMQTVTVVSDAAPTIVAPAAQCYTGSPLTVDLSPNTITTTYNTVKAYTLNGTVLASSIATLNGPGIYTLGIRDDNGCEATTTYTVVDQLIAGAVLVKDLTCAPTPAAMIVVTITGGTGPFTVQTLLGGVPTGAAVTGVTGPVYTANPTVAGIYSFVITDSYTPTCSVTTDTVEVTTPVTPTFTAVATDATCNGDSEGTITLTPIAGLAPFTFALNGVGANPTGNATGNYSGLPAGSYTVLITDANGCQSAAAAAIVINQPIVVSATISVSTPLSCGSGNITQVATVTAQGFGGNGSYQYNFNNQGFTPSNTFVTNTAGPVSVIVRDTNGCSFVTAVSTTVIALNPPTNMDITGTLIYCAPIASSTSTITISNVQNGVGAFTYQMLTPAIINNSTNNVFSGLAPGDYLFQVTDNNGCTYQELYTVAPVTNITAAVSATTNVSCFGLANGTATINVTNFGTTYTAILTPGTGTVSITGNTVTITGMQPAVYNLRVTDDLTGCIADVPITITQPAAALDFTAVATNINCDVDTATITVTAFDGTPNYQYAVVANTAAAPTSYGASNQLIVDTTSGTNMLWDVYVRDANACETFKTVTILLDANPTIASAVATFCPSPTGTYQITVIATGFSSALKYSAGGGNYQTGNVITVNAPGPYTITVKDANGCISAGFPVLILDPLILTPTVTTPPSCTDGDGVIAVLTTGGSGNYEYRIDTGVYGMAVPFTGIASGTHIIYVRDTTTGCEVFTTVNLQAATLITGFALATTPVTCNGGNDGTITASLNTPAPGINDNPVYLYSLNGGTPQDSPLFSDLTAGTYIITVTSGRGCSESLNIAVIEPAIIVVPAPTVVQFGCVLDNTSNFATITVTGVTGGTVPYRNFEFIKVGSSNTQVYFGPNNMYTLTDLAGGSYIVNVYDDKGCIGSTTALIIIDPYIALDKVNVVINQKITCTNLENITVTATTIGGVATNLEYAIVGVTYDPTTAAPIYGVSYPLVTNLTGVFTNLVIGDYLITVRNLDTNCEIQGVHYVNDPNTFDLTIDNIVDVTCLNDTNGSANITFIDRLITTTPLNGNDAGPFTYSVLNATGISVSTGTATTAGPITISGLAAGTYTVTATLSQTPSCTVSKNFTIIGPNAALDITATSTEITCVVGNNDGTITVAATGGWPGIYEYQLLLNGSEVIAYGTQTEFTGLVAGNYTVNVRDSKGCIDPVNISLVNPTPIAFTATSGAALSCFGDTTATITASAPTGGSGSYLYTLITTFADGTVTNNGPQLSNIFTNLGAGSYQVKVTDSWACEFTTAVIVIAEPALVTASLVLASANTCLQDARLTLTAAGGTAPYVYSVDPTFAIFTAMTGASATFPVAIGTYNYYVRDANGCISFISNDIKIDPVPDLTITAIVTNVISCFGDASGVIVATAQGGLGSYVYTLLDAAGNPVSFTPTQTTAGTFTNLIAGSYLVNVVSVDCQERTTVALVITEPTSPLIQSSIVTNITCSGQGDGKIVITASGGTGIIKYAISPNLNQFFESNVFDDLRPGFYDYIVQDQNGCFIYITGVEITEPNSIFVTTVVGSEMPEVCAGDNDGAFNINITGGIAPYSVSIDARNGVYSTGILGQTQFDFSGLTGSEHIVYVRDANGCTTDHTVILGDSVILNPQATVAYNCVSNSASNSVIITVDPSNNPADLDYALDGSAIFQSSNVFTDLPTGLHSVNVRHSNGCIKAIVFGIIQVDPLKLTITDGGLNEIVATAAGGIKNYQFSLDGESAGSQSSFIITKSGNYTVTVTDASGCTATATRYFEFIDIKIPNAFTPNGDGNNDTWAPTNTINYKDLTFDVFDRYGRKVGSYREGQFWDGRYKGIELPSGDYWYIVKIRQKNDGREFMGHFTLYR